MNKQFFYITVFTLLVSLAIVTLYRGHAHEQYPPDELLPASEYADIDYNVFHQIGEGMNVHLHGIAYAHSDRAGDCTVMLTVSEAEDNIWGDWNREPHPVDFAKQGSFTEGIRIEGQ